MVGKRVRAAVGFAAASVAGGIAALAGGSSWVVAVAAGISGAVGGFAPGWVDAFNLRAQQREEFASLSGPVPSESPAGLLRAERGVVPFTGRHNELTDLLAWCVDPLASAVRLVAGAGGVGKSRLAGELVRRLSQTGWSCSWVGEGGEAEAWRTAAAASGRPVLLVVDYAETRRGLAQLLRSVAAQPERARVLLLARGVGEWWEELGALEEPVRELVGQAGPVVLGRDLGTDLSAAELITAAVPYFAQALGVAIPDGGLRVPRMPSGAVPVLVLHAAALLAVLDASPWAARTDAGDVEVTVGDVLGALLGHERRLWASSRPESLDAAVGGAGCRAAVALACLMAPECLEQAQEALRRVPEFRDASVAVCRQAARWLQGLYPPAEGRWWGSLAPDLVAEHHVCEVLGQSAAAPGVYLAGLDAPDAVRALTVVARAGTHHALAAWVLEGALRADPAGLAVPAIEVAVRTGGVLGSVLARVYADAELPWDELVRVEEAIPYPTLALAALDAVLARRIVDCLPPGTSEEQRAQRSLTLATALGQVGRPAEALASAQEAVEAYRRLAETNPDRYLGNLATALNNLGNRLSELGRPAEALASAQEAVEAYRRLAETNPDRYLGKLATALNQLGQHLSRLGRSDDARHAEGESQKVRSVHDGRDQP